jgi:hypothetical protein
VALLRIDDCVAAKALNKLGVTYENAREIVRQIKGVNELRVDLVSSEKVNHKEQT